MLPSGELGGNYLPPVKAKEGGGCHSFHEILTLNEPWGSVPYNASPAPFP